MKYRDILGYSKEQSKKKIIKEDENTSITDLLKEQFGDTLNETIPALGKEYRNYEKAKKLYLKSIIDLEKGASRVDRTYGKQISYVWKKTVSNNMKKFEDALDDVLRKLQ